MAESILGAAGTLGADEEDQSTFSVSVEPAPQSPAEETRRSAEGDAEPGAAGLSKRPRFRPPRDDISVDGDGGAGGAGQADILGGAKRTRPEYERPVAYGGNPKLPGGRRLRDILYADWQPEWGGGGGGAGSASGGGIGGIGGGTGTGSGTLFGTLCVCACAARGSWLKILSAGSFRSPLTRTRGVKLPVDPQPTTALPVASQLLPLGTRVSAVARVPSEGRAPRSLCRG